MSTAFQLPPWTDEDALPDDKAVWRPYPPVVDVLASPPSSAGDKRVTIELESGERFIARAHLADWTGCKRWRFGWAPRSLPSPTPAGAVG